MAFRAADPAWTDARKPKVSPSAWPPKRLKAFAEHAMLRTLKVLGKSVDVSPAGAAGGYSPVTGVWIGW